MNDQPTDADDNDTRRMGGVRPFDRDRDDGTEEIPTGTATGRSANGPNDGQVDPKSVAETIGYRFGLAADSDPLPLSERLETIADNTNDDGTTTVRIVQIADDDGRIAVHCQLPWGDRIVRRFPAPMLHSTRYEFVRFVHAMGYRLDEYTKLIGEPFDARPVERDWLVLPPAEGIEARTTGTGRKRSHSFATTETDGGEVTGRNRFEAGEVFAHLRDDPVMRGSIGGTILVILLGIALTSVSIAVGGAFVLFGVIAIGISSRS